jgi:hypothetical protein
MLLWRGVSLELDDGVDTILHDVALALAAQRPPAQSGGVVDKGQHHPSNVSQVHAGTSCCRCRRRCPPLRAPRLLASLLLLSPGRRDGEGAAAQGLRGPLPGGCHVQGRAWLTARHCPRGKRFLHQRSYCKFKIFRQRDCVTVIFSKAASVAVFKWSRAARDAVLLQFCTTHSQHTEHSKSGMDPRQQRLPLRRDAPLAPCRDSGEPLRRPSICKVMQCESLVQQCFMPHGVRCVCCCVTYVRAPLAKPVKALRVD